MNFDGFLPSEITRFSSMVELDDPTALPLGVSPLAKNCRFHLTSVRTRDGIQSQFGFVLPNNAPVTGLLSGKVGDSQIPLCFDSTGYLAIESPVGSSKLSQITNQLFTPPNNSSMQATSAFRRFYLAFCNLISSTSLPAVYNPTLGKLDPLGMKNFGQGWQANTSYSVGECITASSPVGGNGHIFRCTTAGISGANQPAFNLGAGNTTNDNTVVWTETTPAMTTSGVAGNIATGNRFMVVLFVNRNGFISGMSQASVITANLNVASFQVHVTPIPLGPANTVARILAFTPAGTLTQIAGTGISAAGPFFWIPPAFSNGIFDLSQIAAGVTVSDVVNGVTMHSTLINDNTTTTVDLNFTDDYLKATLNDVSQYFRKIQVQGCSDIYFSSTMKRIVYKPDNLPSGFYVSLPSDPESVYGDSIIQVAENNSEKLITCRDFKGIIYGLKERSGHVITPTADDPSKWPVTKQWEGSGPCGPRAVDTCTGFMCYVHRSGVYIFTGGVPIRISKEIPITWNNINWGAQQNIWVMIDDETREIRIGIPYGVGVALPNKVLKCNYEESPEFTAPIHFSPFVGKEIATGESYKWSIDDIEANLCIRAERVLTNPSPLMDLPTTQSQILYGSSNPDGVVAAIVPGMFNDNGNGIDWVYETACPVDLLRPNQLGGVQANIDGKGVLYAEVLALRAKDPRSQVDRGPGDRQAVVIPLKKVITAGVPYSCGARAQNERFRLRISNNKQPDNWGDMKWAAIYARPVSSARPG